jgi:hypothetical protein
MNYRIILTLPVFAFILMLAVFFCQRAEIVYLPLHRNLNPDKYIVLSIDTVYNDTLNYKIVKYKKK